MRVSVESSCHSSPSDIRPIAELSFESVVCVEHSPRADDTEAGRVRVLAVNAKDATAVQRLAKSIYAEHGAPDLLFNNAGRQS